MTKNEMNEVFNLYNEEEIIIIRNEMFFASLMNRKAPTTKEELKDFCDRAIKKRN